MILHLFSRLNAETIEIVSNMYTEEILSKACFEKIKNAFEVRIADLTYEQPVTTAFDAIKRYLIFNDHRDEALEACPPEKKVLIMMEPMRIAPEEAQKYSRIYTWDDEVIDNKKYFKYHFPDLIPMSSSLPQYADRKLSTMIVRNWYAKHRLPILEFFCSKPKGEFEFYGAPLPKLAYSKLYRGRIPGINCGIEKIEVLKNYRFCFCFENSISFNGYITEKIFPCFAAGCIPIYWGAPNIHDYIPKECFIDYRAFTDLEELYLYLKTMPEEVYEQYLWDIRKFLNSEKALVFTPETFAQILYEAVLQP